MCSTVRLDLMPGSRRRWCSHSRDEPFGEGDRGEMCVRFGKVGHHGRVAHTNARVTDDVAVSVDHCGGIAGLSHSAGPDGMDVVGDRGPEPIVNRGVIVEFVDRSVQRQDLTGDIRYGRMAKDLDDPARAIP